MDTVTFLEWTQENKGFPEKNLLPGAEEAREGGRQEGQETHSNTARAPPPRIQGRSSLAGPKGHGETV